VEDPTRCADQIAAAFREPGPVLVEAVVDPLEAPMPPHVTVEQATNFARSLARGEPDRAAILEHAVIERVRELV
jgi:pyruvate dehydrogenase (quinone)/pyruvate oxidase